MRKFNLSLNKPLRTSTCFLIIVLICIKASSQTYSIDTLMRNGERYNRINLVYLSEGYLIAEMPAFRTHADKIHNSMFSQAPFLQYKNFFNSYAIKVPSPESGAKHPGNATDEATDPQPIANPTTNFGSTFDFNLIHRLLVVPDASPVNNTLANNFPDYTQPFVLVNSNIYGGSGGHYATTSANFFSDEIAIHEMGHSFAQLADEYWVSDMYANEYPNMTSNSDPATIKWKNWLGTNGIGIYRYGTSGSPANWYRPHEDCKMQKLGFPFCSVCTERFIDVIHDKIDMIDAVTPSASSITLRNKDNVPFSVTAIQTIPSPVNIKWYLNSSPTPFSTGQFSVSIPFASFTSGMPNTVRAEVTDNSPLSRSYLPGIGYVNNQTWTVNISSEALPVHLISFTGKAKDDDAMINWEIDSPDDLQVFELEKSMDGLNFTRVASVAGEQFKKHYSYNDTKLFKPYTYYRLKTIEKTGLFHYSNIIQLQSSFEKFYYKVYQNADNHRYHLSIAMTSEEKVSFRITDIQGRVITKKDFGKPGKQVEYDFDLNGKPSGIYYMNLFINNSSYTIPLVAK